MSKNKVQDPFVGPIKEMQVRQGEHHSNYFRGRHRVVMLTNKEKLVDFSAASTNATYADKDVRLKSDGVTASSVSDDTIAVILQVIIQDTGSATANCDIHVRKNGSTDDPAILVAKGGHLNSTNRFYNGIVGIDSNYLIEHKRTASGAGTLTGSINLIGYIEQLS